MGLVKTRRLAAMQKQQRAKAGMKPPAPKPVALPLLTRYVTYFYERLCQ